jgi:hypothetical protein
VALTITPGPIVAVDGEGRLDSRGHLSLSLAVRRRCRIATGDRVLVIVNRQQANLLVIPMTVVHDMVESLRQRPLGRTSA